jgi:hypothetical protein
LSGKQIWGEKGAVAETQRFLPNNVLLALKI